MSAPTTQQPGINYILKHGSTEIGGGTDATLNMFQNLTEATNKDSGRWRKYICGTRGGLLDFSNMYVDDGDQVCGSTLGFTVGGTAVKGMTNVSLDVSVNAIESVNSTTGLTRQIVPANRQLTVTVQGEWYDIDLDPTPTQGDEALEDVIDAIDGTATTALTCVLTFGAQPQSYSFSARPTSFSLSAPVDGIMAYSFTLETVGSVSAPTTTGADAGQILFLADVFNTSGAQSFTALLVRDAADADYTEFTGTCYPESVNITIPYSGVVTISGTMVGSGALTKQAQAA